MTANPLTNDQAERAVLGAMIVTPTLCDSIHARLDAEAFTGDARKTMFNTLIDLHAAGIPIDDPIVLLDRLERLGRIDAVGGMEAVEEALSTRIDNADHYIDCVRDLCRRRRIVDIAQRAIVRAHRGGLDDTADDIAESMRAATLSIDAGSSDNEIQTIAEIVTGSIDRAERVAAGDKTAAGIPTSVPVIDRATGGVFPGLTVIAARPSMGKTALGYQILGSAARAGIPAFFISLEMTNQQIGDRTIAADTGTNSMILRSGKLDAERLSSLRAYVDDDLTGVPLHVWRPKQPQTIERIAAMTRLHVAKHHSRIIAIDHLLKIKPTDNRDIRHEQIAHIVCAAKNLATELDLPVLLLTQAKRKDGRAADQSPTVDELYGSSMIEAEADDVWLIHRADRDATEATIKLAKFRNGAVQTLDVWFDPVRTEFGSPSGCSHLAEWA
ncbi:replicative DNA helicase [Neorhodopirellula pilleata]|uniref:DNA 5'-3' helicase n=1 Tax=Neorhodopirellula pilleata TaxID=2714738 RepID=A0A5C5ZLJ1_9BACT|nr:DnaB-like helicase C-terminal domain-containing protein [Neorhodopirellula pilleata]TWT88010.1 Replicative DNA helicase [Neorhodopirellula pilleata]